MIVPDHQLMKNGERLVYPFKPANVQPASIDLTLDSYFLTPRQFEIPIDLANVKGTTGWNEIYADYFKLESHCFILGSTAEIIKMPSNMVGRVEGKSSLGRLGLMVHSTAGFIDPGFEGKITLEFYNLNDRTIILRPGLRICQISVTELNSPAERPYGAEGLGSHYQGQDKTTASRYEG